MSKNQSSKKEGEADDADEDRKNLEKEEEEDQEVMEGFKSGGADHEHNMKSYIENYGVPIMLPGMYVLDSKIYP